MFLYQLRQKIFFFTETLAFISGNFLKFSDKKIYISKEILARLRTYKKIPRNLNNLDFA